MTNEVGRLSGLNHGRSDLWQRERQLSELEVGRVGADRGHALGLAVAPAIDTFLGTIRQILPPFHKSRKALPKKPLLLDRLVVSCG